MDWQGIIGSAGQQNAIFWGGAAAVALGSALLVATLGARLRQRLRRPFALPRIPARQAAAAYQASERTDSDLSLPNSESAAAGLALAARVLAETAVPPAPSLAILLRRLQLAGDRLEEVAQAVAQDNDDLDDTRLKEDTNEVEYVFKACAP
jgi:hypothetical protein